MKLTKMQKAIAQTDVLVKEAEVKGLEAALYICKTTDTPPCWEAVQKIEELIKEKEKKKVD